MNNNNGCLWFVLLIGLFVTCDRQERMDRDIEDLQEQIEKVIDLNRDMRSG